jgi:hypothetical protein
MLLDDDVVTDEAEPRALSGSGFAPGLCSGQRHHLVLQALAFPRVRAHAHDLPGELLFANDASH